MLSSTLWTMAKLAHQTIISPHYPNKALVHGEIQYSDFLPACHVNQPTEVKWYHSCTASVLKLLSLPHPLQLFCVKLWALLPSKVRYWIRLFNIKWKTVLIFSKWLGQLCNYIFHALQNGALAHYKGVWCVTAMSELHSSLATQLILRHQQPFYYLGKSNKYFRFYLVSHAQVS